MATVMTAHIPDATPELYDAINKELGFPGSVPDGLIAHYAASTAGGMLIFDVWESREKFEDFAAGMLGPAMQKVTGGTGSGIQPTFAELHNEFHR